MLRTETTLYRRERWQTRTADRSSHRFRRVFDVYGRQFRRLILMIHVQGQMTFARSYAAVLPWRGDLQATARASHDCRSVPVQRRSRVFPRARPASLSSRRRDGARHAGKGWLSSQIGSDRFAVFRTGPSKSRLAFLRNLMGGVPSYVINVPALAYMRASHLAHGVIDALAGADVLAFPSHVEWIGHLRALGVTALKVAPVPVRAASSGRWGGDRGEGLIGRAVIVSDDAGQFRVGEHALCWVHAERLVHKFLPANDRQRNAIEVARRMIWWFYRQLKDYKSAPNPQRATELSARSSASSSETGYATLDRILKRRSPKARKTARARAADRSQTNASETTYGWLS